MDSFTRFVVTGAFVAVVAAIDGIALGAPVGFLVGTAVFTGTGTKGVGFTDGLAEATTVGAFDATSDGIDVMFGEGAALGTTVGAVVLMATGASVGWRVGASVIVAFDGAEVGVAVVVLVKAGLLVGAEV
jgi:hypothetical protein